MPAISPPRATATREARVICVGTPSREHLRGPEGFAARAYRAHLVVAVALAELDRGLEAGAHVGGHDLQVRGGRAGQDLPFDDLRRSVPAGVNGAPADGAARRV